MLILHVVAPGEVGGLERVVLTLGGALRDAGHEVHVAVVTGPDAGEHPFSASAAAAGLVVHRLPLPPRGYRREHDALRTLYGRLRPDVLHTHGYRPDVIAGMAARRLPLATVSTVHGFTGGDWKNRLYERLQRRALARMDAVVAVSRPLHADLARSTRKPGRVHLVPNAWRAGGEPLEREAARACLGITNGTFHVGWVGRLSAEKGADVLLDALPRLDGVSLTVSMVGAGREAARLRQRAERAGVGARVRWHGAVPDAARLYRGFDAFVLSSRTEGTPLVLFEAMAAGTPIVATAVGGVPDVVTEREALLIPPEDPAALAAALRRLLHDGAGATHRARAAHARLHDHFGATAWVGAYERVYREARAMARERHV